MDAHKKTKPYWKNIHTKIVNSAYLWAMELGALISCFETAFSNEKCIICKENILTFALVEKITFKYV